MARASEPCTRRTGWAIEFEVDGSQLAEDPTLYLTSELKRVGAARSRSGSSQPPSWPSSTKPRPRSWPNGCRKQRSPASTRPR
eukprot:9844954-Alexandrium_andersonii.AAC.1